MNPQPPTDRAQTRQNLLDELESIRSLLRHEPADLPPAAPPILEVPVLHDTVPAVADGIPLLHPEPVAGHAPATSIPAREDVRAAAAFVAARAARLREQRTQPDAPRLAPASPAGAPQQAPDQEALVQAILAALKPELEQLLRRILAEQFTAPASGAPEKP